MKKILILVERLDRKKKILTNYLNKNSDAKYKVFLYKFSDLLFDIKTNSVQILINGKVDIASFNLVFIRRAGGKYTPFTGAIVKYLDFRKVDFIDPALREIGLTMDKASTSTRLAMRNIPMPDTYFCFRDSIEKFKLKISEDLSFPIIAKGIGSQRNEAIYILRSIQGFEELMSKSKDEFIFQKYISIKKEFRLLVMGGEVKVLELKSKRNYSSQKVEYINPNEPSVFLNLSLVSKQMKDLAVECARLLSLDLAGVDICIEKETNTNYVFEVNRGPGILPDPNKSPELKAFSDYFKKRLTND